MSDYENSAPVSADRYRSLLRERDQLRREQDVAIAERGALRSRVAELEAARCPRCGEWVRDFPSHAQPTESEERPNG